MGTDQWDAILRWNRALYLASLVKFIVISRGEDPKIIKEFPSTHISGAHSASATFIRSNPTSYQTKAWLHPHVFSYIKNHDLY